MKLINAISYLRSACILQINDTYRQKTKKKKKACGTNKINKNPSHQLENFEFSLSFHNQNIKFYLISKLLLIFQNIN